MINSSVPWDPAFENLVRRYLYPVPEELSPNLNLRASGLNSYSLLALLVDIEKEYGRKIPADLLVFDSFETPATLWAVVQKAGKLQEASQENVDL